MEEELQFVTDWLLDASEEVSTDYFQLPVAGSENPEYRERVYCYELYHQWRSCWDVDFPFSLCGEINKQGHPLIRGNEQPDFLVHIPGQMCNLLIIEVKPANSTPARMAEDLKKLTRFSRNIYDQDGLPASYEAAYFWLYGLAIEHWPTLRERILRSIDESPEFDPDLVSCWIHERPGERASLVSWY